MLKSASLLTPTGELVAPALNVEITRDVDGSLVGSFTLPKKTPLQAGSYRLHFATGETATILIEGARFRRVRFVVFGELK